MSSDSPKAESNHPVEQSNILAVEVEHSDMPTDAFSGNQTVGKEGTYNTDALYQCAGGRDAPFYSMVRPASFVKYDLT